MALDVVADYLVGLIQLRYGFIDLMWPIASVRTVVDICDAYAVDLRGVTDETVALGIEQ